MEMSMAINAIFSDFLSITPLPVLFLILLILMFCLVRGADLLVEEAIALSARLRVSPVLIGATVVSLGTTAPEVTVSMFAAVQGQPEIALGNAVGSIICNTGLILGLITLFAPITIKNDFLRRQGWFQLMAGILLVVSCIPVFGHPAVFKTGGNLPRQMGMVFLVLLILYLAGSFRLLEGERSINPINKSKLTDQNIRYIFFKVLSGSFLVVASAHFLISVVQETSLRLSVPGELVSATLVALGTSLPELATAITAVGKGHGELAMGNIIGANILNVLFVAGASASLTSNGLEAPAYFFRLLFPAMMVSLVIFRLGVHSPGGVFKKCYSIMLLSIYGFVTMACFF
jgi:cation:H+ antiporter